MGRMSCILLSFFPSPIYGVFEATSCFTKWLSCCFCFRVKMENINANMFLHAIIYLYVYDKSLAFMQKYTLVKITDPISTIMEKL